MRRGGRKLTHSLGCRGTTALEFAFLAPIALMFLFGTLGIGMVGVYQQALDNAVRDAARQVQIYDVAASTKADFVAGVCASGLAVITSTCSTSITYSVQASSVTAGFAGLVPEAVSAAGTLSNSFFSNGTAFAPNVNVLVQVCYFMPFRLPYFTTVLTGTSSDCLYSTSAVRVEPYS